VVFTSQEFGSHLLPSVNTQTRRRRAVNKDFLERDMLAGEFEFAQGTRSRVAVVNMKHQILPIENFTRAGTGRARPRASRAPHGPFSLRLVTAARSSPYRPFRPARADPAC